MINFHYNNILEDLTFAKKIGNTHELMNYRFSFPIKNNILKYRHMSISYLLAEMIWYFAGKDDTNFIGEFASFWKNISDDDVHANSAYGYIAKSKFDVNQIEQVIEILKSDPNSRRGLININTPHNNRKDTKDEPCTIALQFFIRDNVLCSTSIMRSNDVWFGLPYDIVFFTELSSYIARRLNVDTGQHTHFVTSLHMYDRDLNKIKNVIDNFIYDNEKEININFEKLIDEASELYKIVTKENILKICSERGILL